jgi:hypothetical protein
MRLSLPPQTLRQQDAPAIEHLMDEANMLGADREKGTPDCNEFATAQGSISARLSVLRRPT